MDDIKYVRLTQEQIKLLEWLGEEGYLINEIQYQSFSSADFIEL